MVWRSGAGVVTGSLLGLVLVLVLSGVAPVCYDL